MVEPTTQLRWIKLSQMRPSELQPRKHFSEEAIAELVASFREHGFDAGVSHLLVRPIGMEQFELVCGERRWRAAQELKLESAPAVVQAMDDLHVLKLQLVENLQRESLNAMEEALAYRRLEEMGQSREQIAASVGKTLHHVNQRIVLCRLIGSPIAEAIETDKISPSHGRVLAGVPSAALRNELLQKVLHPPDGSAAPWSRELLEQHVRMDYVRDLREAKFDKEDPNLVPIDFEDGHEFDETYRAWGGACTDCPFNVVPEGASKMSRARVCTNLECWRAKELATHERWRQEVGRVKEQGSHAASTLSHAENEALWNESGTALAHNSPYVELDELPDLSEVRVGVVLAPWRQLVKGQKIDVVLGLDANLRVHELVRHDLAKKAAHLNGHEIFRDSGRESRADQELSVTADAPLPMSEEERAEEAQDRKAEVAARNAAITDIVKAAEKSVRAGHVILPKEFWGAMAACLLDVMEGDKLVEMRGRRDQDFSVATLSLGERLGLVVECLIMLSGDAGVWAKLFGVRLRRSRSSESKLG